MMQTKQIDQILGPEAWENVDQTSGIHILFLKNFFKIF